MLRVCTQSSRWYQESDPEGSLRFISECGFESIDYSINNHLPANHITGGNPTTFFDQSTEELLAYYQPMKEAAERNHIEISQMHAPFPLHIEGREDLNDYLIMVVDKCCAVCQYLRCPALVVHPFVHYDRKLEWEVNLAMYRRMMPSARKYGVTLCLENMLLHHRGRLIEAACSTAEEACRYIDTLNQEAGEALFGFCFDVGHANLVGRNLRSFINTLGPRLTVLHLHDNTGITDGHLIPYTQNTPGGIDWDNLLEGLKDIGYAGALSFETFYGIFLLPKEAQEAGLKLVCAIGRHFRNRLQQ